ncbi:hypothetical protein llg_35610 [Luteolibacter sp. LG18]|nr:hypothetical protein llg_35610 [Luteolibacter sp. LG18]
MVPMLATGAAGAWAWNKATSVPNEIRAKQDFFKAVAYKKPWTYDMPDEVVREQTRQATEEMLAKLYAEFPAMKGESHPVPDDENGFLLLHQLSGAPHRTGPPVSPELRKLLNDPSIPWDAAQAKRLLEENAEVVARIERIAALKTRSSDRMPRDYGGFIGARAAKTSADILLMKARLAAEAKDEPEVLRLINATQNLGSHFREVETPNLLGETVTILIDLSVRHAVFDSLLPAFGRDADLPKWKTALVHRSYGPAPFAKVMRGEWETTARYYLLPGILRPKHPDNPPDAEALARYQTSCFNTMITRMSGLGMAEFLTDPGLGEPRGEHLSKRSREILNMLWIGSRAWAKGYVRAASTLDQYQAALELLESEKQGATLASGPLAGATRDPLGGEPYLFDAATRTVSGPPAALKAEVKPIRLPW